MSPLLALLKSNIASLNPSRIVVGFSGGLDSSALLHGLSSLKLQNSKGNNIPLIAVHVHHGLSEHADEWLSHCANICQKWSVEFISERVSLKGSKGSLENAARTARYAAFEQHLQEGDALLLAHHQDDQVETFMMRLMRGSGLTGLSAMQAQRAFASATISRPWLTCSRAELEAYVTEHNIEHIEDESNTDTQFDRNWWRQGLLPRLFKRYPQASARIEKTIRVLQQERQVLNDLLEPIYHAVIKWDGIFTQSNILNCTALLTYPTSVQKQLLRMWLETEGVYPLLNGDQIEQIIRDVVNAREDASPIYQWGNQEIRRYAGCLYAMSAGGNQGINEAQAAKAEMMYFSTETVTVSIQSGRLAVIGSVENGLKEGEYHIAYYSGSTLAKPLKRPSKSLKKWFQAYNVPPWLRTQWPVIMQDKQVVCVPGLFVCEGFTCEKGLAVTYLA